MSFASHRFHRVFTVTLTLNLTTAFIETFCGRALCAFTNPQTFYDNSKCDWVQEAWTIPMSRKDVLRNLSYLKWCERLSKSSLLTLKTHCCLKVFKCTFSCCDNRRLFDLVFWDLIQKGYCQKWDSNPRLQGRLRPERSALDRSAILTYFSLVYSAKWEERGGALGAEYVHTDKNTLLLLVTFCRRVHVPLCAFESHSLKWRSY